MKIAKLCTYTIVEIACLSQIARGSPQLYDSMSFGGRKYIIYQRPMNELWHYGDAAIPEGKQRPPQFDATSPGNWLGYAASWEIQDSKLFLRDIRGRVAGKAVRNQAILPQLTFPALATWFTGKIYLPVGDFIEDKNEYEAVIVFEIEKGCVKVMTFLPSWPINYSLNGL